MNIEDYARLLLKDANDALDKLEEKDPKIAERLAFLVMMNISERWRQIMDSNRKTEKLKNVDNLN